MPIHYRSGILKEHIHTRTEAGLFDVSHMGQLVVRPLGGDLIDAALALEELLAVDLVGLRRGRQRYALLTTETGGIRDDLMIANLGQFFLLVVNAGSTAADFEYLRDNLLGKCTVEAIVDRVLLAIQGPAASMALSGLLPDAAAMRFMDVETMRWDGAACYVSRSGYTGEDGFEISMPRERAEAFATALLKREQVELIGLGARDSLRLEAGLCLYGQDLNIDVTPVEAGLEWAISSERRAAGARAGGFPGADVISNQLAQGATRRRVGLNASGRPVRAGALLFSDEQSQLPLGHVTSGTFGPSVQRPIAMGYVPIAQASPGTQFFAEVAGHRIPITVGDLPFFSHRYHR